ncbi:hypothetical protein AQUCO_02700080v1 [Aquilegia coerulea]|uniref:Uncharacterized protein n=1 Tax=Aquilegia coerulea TaxID=218851 RepID=A0A2G5D521_AQUCA|nr:hypothetical protein AQUCO_02700080v1 [Aquilegia coerulea]
MLNCCYCYDDLAVQVLLASREHLNLGKVKNNNYNESAASGNSEVKMQDIDPIQFSFEHLVLGWMETSND